jgi:hypothetical protein
MKFPSITSFSNAIFPSESANEKKEKKQPTINYEPGKRSRSFPLIGGKSRQISLVNLLKKNKASSKSDSNGSHSRTSSSSSLSSQSSTTSTSRRSLDAAQPTSAQVAAMRTHHARLCEEAEGDNLVGVMARVLNETSPDFQNMKRKDVKQLVRSYIDSLSNGTSNTGNPLSQKETSTPSVTIRHNNLSDTGNLRQQAMKAVHESLRAEYGDNIEGLITEMAGVLRDQSSAFAGVSKKEAKKLVAKFLDQQTGTRIQSAMGIPSAPLTAAQEFRNKWGNTPFHLPEHAFQSLPLTFTLHYGRGGGSKAVRELAQLNTEGKSGIHDCHQDQVIVAAPTDIEFASVKQCALYVKAMGLAQLHERRAQGYSAPIGEDNLVWVAGVPAHAKLAAEAKELMQEILNAGSEGLERFDVRLDQLNRGLAFLEPEQIDTRIDDEAWQVILEQNPGIRAELLQMSEQDLASDPLMQTMQTRMQSIEETKDESSVRRQQLDHVHSQVNEQLAGWVQQALKSEGGNVGAARENVEETIRQFFADNLTGELWRGPRAERKAERYLKNNAAKIDEQIQAQSEQKKIPPALPPRELKIAMRNRMNSKGVLKQEPPPIPSRSTKPGVLAKVNNGGAPRRPLPPPPPPPRQNAVTNAINATTAMSQTGPFRTVAEFRNKWENQSFWIDGTKLDISLRLGDNGGITPLKKVGNADQVSNWKDGYQVTVPGDREFASARHYALYAEACCLAELHQRRTSGYTISIAEFHPHTVPPAPKHAGYASAAQNLAEQCLLANADLTQIARSIASLNVGLGWRRNAADDTVGSQIQKAIWNAKSTFNKELARDLMEMSGESVASDPLLSRVREGLHNDAKRKREDVPRMADRAQALTVIGHNLESWVRAAVAEHKTDADQAQDAVRANIRRYCDETFTGPHWHDDKVRVASNKIFRELEDKIDALIAQHMRA